MNETGTPLVILHVEDDPAHALIVRRNLGEARLLNRLMHVSDGLEALDYLYRKGKYADPDTSPRPGVILLDLRLPRLDGLEVLARIKDDVSLKTIPVVVLTTSDDEEDLKFAYAHNVNSYLVKPVNFKSFAEMMETLGFYWVLWNKTPQAD